VTQEVGGSSPLFHPQQDMVFNGLACMVWDHISCERHIMVDYATLIRSSRWFDSTRSYILFRKECIIHDKPEWRNWQTRLTQNQIPKGVWVRLPLWVGRKTMVGSPFDSWRRLGSLAVRVRVIKLLVPKRRHPP
jgi:hypothetical protein